MIEKHEIVIRHTYHAPKEGQPAKYEALRAAARHFAEVVNELCPDSRESALAHTNIEQAAFWANAAIARRSSP